MLSQKLRATVQYLLINFFLHGQLIVKQLLDWLFNSTEFGLSILLLLVQGSIFLGNSLDLLVVTLELGTHLILETALPLDGLGED